MLCVGAFAPADVIVLYIDLPRCIYPPNQTKICHQKAAELLFRDQPVLRNLDTNNRLITVTERSGLNHTQKTVLSDWIAKPVRVDPKVFSTAAAVADFGNRVGNHGNDNIGDYVIDAEVTHSRQRRQRNQPFCDNDLDLGFVAATDVTRRSESGSGQSRSDIKGNSDDSGHSNDSGWISFINRAKRKKKESPSAKVYGSISGTICGFRRTRRSRKPNDDELRPLLEMGINQTIY